MVPVDAQPVFMPETGESGSAAIMGSNVAPEVVDHADPQKRAVVAVTVLSIVASLVLLSLAASMVVMYKRRQLQKNRHVVERRRSCPRGRQMSHCPLRHGLESEIGASLISS
jgi:hypothetical protein